MGKPVLGASTLYAWRDGNSPKLFEQIIHRSNLLWEIIDEESLAINEDDALKLHAIKRDHQTVFAVHVPFLKRDIFSSDLIHRMESIKFVKRSIELANRYEAKFAVIHPGYRNDEILPEEMAGILNELFDLAASLGIVPVLENLSRKTAFYKPDEIKQFQKLLLKPNFALDVGHANMENCLEEFMRINRSFCYFHIHDNLGLRDDHLPLGKGTINWGRFFSEVIRTDPERPLVVENLSLEDLEVSLDFASKMLS